MPEYFVLVPIALTSLAAVAVGAAALGLERRGLPAALGKVLEAVGLTLAFSVLNLFAGAALILLGRLATGRFVPLYYASDVVLVICSLLQALVFQRWREAKPAPSPGRPRKAARWMGLTGSS